MIGDSNFKAFSFGVGNVLKDKNLAFAPARTSQLACLAANLLLRENIMIEYFFFGLFVSEGFVSAYSVLSFVLNSERLMFCVRTIKKKTCV